MRTFINPTVVITNPVKNKSRYTYTTISKKYPDQLVIKQRDTTGESRGIVGVIEKDGTIVCKKDYIRKSITPTIMGKIQLTLDLVFKHKMTVLNTK